MTRLAQLRQHFGLALTRNMEVSLKYKRHYFYRPCNNNHLLDGGIQ
jgi:hypothetical protein